MGSLYLPPFCSAWLSSSCGGGRGGGKAGMCPAFPFEKVVSLEAVCVSHQDTDLVYLVKKYKLEMTFLENAYKAFL